MDDKELVKEYLVKFGIAIFCLIRAYATIYLIAMIFPMLSKPVCIVLIVMMILFELFCRTAFSGGKNEDDAISNLVSYCITTSFSTVLLTYSVIYYAYQILPK